MNFVVSMETDFSRPDALAGAVGAFFIMTLVAQLIIAGLAPAGVKDKLYFGSCVISPPLVCIMSYYSVLGVLGLWDTAENRVFGTTYYTNVFVALYMGNSITLIVTEMVNESLSLKTIPMLLHHVTTIVVFTTSQLDGRFGFYCCAAGVIEITTFPLSILYLSKTKGGGVADFMEAALGSALQVNGGLLWLTYLIFRMLWLPYVLVRMLLDFGWGLGDAKRQDLSRWEVATYPAVILFIFVLSCVWFEKINSGFMKILRGEATAAGAAPEKAE